MRAHLLVQIIVSRLTEQIGIQIRKNMRVLFNLVFRSLFRFFGFPGNLRFIHNLSRLCLRHRSFHIFLH